MKEYRLCNVHIVIGKGTQRIDVGIEIPIIFVVWKIIVIRHAGIESAVKIL